jgi:hypothetical protein
MSVHATGASRLAFAIVAAHPQEAILSTLFPHYQHVCNEEDDNPCVSIHLLVGKGRTGLSASKSVQTFGLSVARQEDSALTDEFSSQTAASFGHFACHFQYSFSSRMF